MNNNRFKIMTVIGIVLLGLYILTARYIPSADAALETACRTELTSRGGSALQLLDRCNEQAFATVMTAQDARTAAKGASSANQTEVLVHMISMFALGLGIVLTIIGLASWFGFIKPRRKEA